MGGVLLDGIEEYQPSHIYIEPADTHMRKSNLFSLSFTYTHIYHFALVSFFSLNGFITGSREL